MVNEQLVTRSIRDSRVLEAMGNVVRHAFVPSALEEDAYRDQPLPIGHGQTISQPYIVALMAELLQLKPTDRVLEIGTGSGYGAAVLSELAGEVVTIERHEELANRARLILEQLGYDRVEVQVGDGTLGWPAKAPYDAIAVTASGPMVPQELRDQLAIGGRLVMPIGHDLASQNLVLVERRGPTEYAETNICPVRFVPLVGARGWSAH
jgi:protein-L-isoaspartate(D-aspartate) O-methyltransferase